MFKSVVVAAVLLASTGVAYASWSCPEVYSEESAIEELCSFHEGFSRIKIHGRWGFINKSGQMVIEPQFEEVRNFHEGLAEVKIDEKWGFIDTQGVLRIPAKFVTTWPFSEGLAVVHEQGGKAGYINTKGEWAIPPRFESAAPFENGVAVVSDNYPENYLIDSHGLVIKRFDKGIRLEDNSSFGVYVATQEAKSILVHHDGRQLPVPASAASNIQYSQGYLLAQNADSGHVGTITVEGNQVIAPQFSELGIFKQGLAIATMPGDVLKKGVVNTDGKYVIPAIYSQIDRLDSGRYLAKPSEFSAKAEVFDVNGKPLFTATCEDLTETPAGQWTVFHGQECNQSWVVAANGKILKYPFKNPDIEFSSNYLLLSVDASNDSEASTDSKYAKHFVLLNAKGLVLSSASPEIKDQWDWIALINPKGPSAEAAPELLPVAILIKGFSQLGIVTHSHKIVTRPEWHYDSDAINYKFDEDTIFDGPLVMPTESGWGAIDGEGRWVIVPKYFRITNFKNGLAFTREFGQEGGLLDSKGEEYAFPDGYQYKRVAPWTIEGFNQDRQPVRYNLKTKELTLLIKEPDVRKDEASYAGLSAAEKGGHWGLIDKNGNWRVPPTYDFIKAELDGKTFLGWETSLHYKKATETLSHYGWLSAEGKELISPQYDGVTKEANSDLFVVSMNGRYGLLNKDAKVLLPTIYKSIKTLGDGWAIADQGELKGTVSAQGEWLIRPSYYELYYLDQRPYSQETISGKSFMLHVNGTQSSAENPQPFTADKPEYWLAETTGDYNEEKTTFYGFDWKPRLTIPGKIAYNHFSEDRIIFASDVRDGYPTAIADTQGQVYGPFPYTEIDDFHNGRARFKQNIVSKGKKRQTIEEELLGYLDANGTVVIPAQYQKADHFSENRAIVLVKGNLGVIDPQGNILLHSAWRCGVRPVLLNNKGEVIWPAKEKTNCK